MTRIAPPRDEGRAMTASKTQPALLGGLFIGVLSALPVVNLGNCCCCLWVVAGGALAVYLLQQNDPAPVSTADAATVGLTGRRGRGHRRDARVHPDEPAHRADAAGWVDEVLRTARRPARRVAPRLRSLGRPGTRGPGRRSPLACSGSCCRLVIVLGVRDRRGRPWRRAVPEDAAHAGRLPPVPPLAPPPTSPF